MYFVHTDSGLLPDNLSWSICCIWVYSTLGKLKKNTLDIHVHFSGLEKNGPCFSSTVKEHSMAKLGGILGSTWLWPTTKSIIDSDWRALQKMILKVYLKHSAQLLNFRIHALIHLNKTKPGSALGSASAPLSFKVRKGQSDGECLSSHGLQSFFFTCCCLLNHRTMCPFSFLIKLLLQKEVISLLCCCA